MGQKINPISNRLPLSLDWRSRWIDTHTMPYFILEDATIRRIIDKRFGKNALIERVDIERDAQELRIGIYTGKPGILIGRGGMGISNLKTEIDRCLQSIRDTKAKRLVKLAGRRRTIPTSLKIDVFEIKDGDRRASIVAQTVATQLERRMAHRRAANQAIEKSLSRSVKGIRITLSGRLGGAEIARRETYSKGAMPMSTLNQDIDYARATATTTYGTVGVTVWVYRGEDLKTASESLPMRK